MNVIALLTAEIDITERKINDLRRRMARNVTEFQDLLRQTSEAEQYQREITAARAQLEGDEA